MILTDLEFVARVRGLRADIQAMREFLKLPGHLDRLFDLAIKGAKKPPKNKARSALPLGFPDQPQIDRAKGFWAMEKRPDLVIGAEGQAAEFRDHHTGRGTLAADWNATWGTWMRRALQYTRPPRTGPVAVPNIFEETSINGWVRRLEVFHGTDRDDDAHPGIWTPKWGEKPDQPGNLVPQAAWQAFDRQHPGRRAAS